MRRSGRPPSVLTKSSSFPQIDAPLGRRIFHHAHTHIQRLVYRSILLIPTLYCSRLLVMRNKDDLIAEGLVGWLVATFVFGCSTYPERAVECVSAYLMLLKHQYRPHYRRWKPFSKPLREQHGHLTNANHQRDRPADDSRKRHFVLKNCVTFRLRGRSGRRGVPFG